MKTPKAVILVSCFLFVAVLAVFGRTVRYGFVNFDDDQYVYRNAHVTGGLSGQGVVWAFTHNDAQLYWQPLTWLSLMLDCQLFPVPAGDDGHAGGPHATNVLLHAATAVLLFLLLRRMTGVLWPSALAAILFAVHPLRTESVAWVTERKDVLSGLFFMLTVWAYVAYAGRPFSWIRYGLVMLLYALGLMAKPMLVTLPLLLLLLDYWPLGRFAGSQEGQVGDRAQALRRAGRLLLEKLPLLALTAASCAATVLAQAKWHSGDLKPLPLPLTSRAVDALAAPVAYLGRFLWPARLTLFYRSPHDQWSAAGVAACVVLLAAISIAAVALRRKHPYLLVGWFWYLGMLAPVTGLVQVGGELMPDRFTYLPMIGVTVALVWLLASLAGAWRWAGVVLALAAAPAVAALMACTWQQTGFWRDSETLWRHTLECNSRNALALNSLGATLVEQGKLGEAEENFVRALKIDPEYVNAQVNLAELLTRQGKLDAGIDIFSQILQKHPDDFDAQFGIALALMRQQRCDEATTHFRAALKLHPDPATARINLVNFLLSEAAGLDEAITIARDGVQLEPDSAAAHLSLAQALMRKGNVEEAIQQYQRVAELNPKDPAIHNVLADLLQRRGEASQAIEQYRKALAAAPNNASACCDLGTTLVKQGKIDEAIECYHQALKIDPSLFQAHVNLAALLYLQGKRPEAIAQWEALPLRPEAVPILNVAARLLATCPAADARNGAKALELAQRAAQVTARREATILDTLAAAYAETGQYAEAVATARAARDLAIQQGNAGLAEAISARIKLYEHKTPFRDESLAPPARKP